MTDDDLNAIEAAANAATPGPWHVYQKWRIEVWDKDNYQIADIGYIGDVDEQAQEVMESDAAFIAGSREWVPALVAEERQLWPLVEALAAIELCYREQPMEYYCPVCEGSVDPDWRNTPYGMDSDDWAEQRLYHLPDCARQQAKALMAQRKAE